MENLKDLADLLDSQGLLVDGPLPERVPCDGGAGPFAQFGPCRCVDCEPSDAGE